MTVNNKIIAAAFMVLAALPTDSLAQQIAGGQVTVKNTTVKKSGQLVNVGMDLDLSKLDLKRNKGLILTPMLVNGNDTAKMKTIEIMGRNRYIYYQRNNKTATEAPGAVERRYNGDEQTLNYSAILPYERWMNNSQLIMAEGACGCNQTLLGDNVNDTIHGVVLGGEWKLQYAYVQPKPEPIKSRAVEGSARLNFVVDKYDIRPNFGNNAAELSKIRETIDLVKNDEDVEITDIQLHGYASPDGSYNHNAELAANRTEALRQYLVNYYSKLKASLFSTQSTPEDWVGTREAIEASTLKDKEALLDIIDSELTPDEKDRTFASKYGDVYRTILREIYPPLRRTDYKVCYNIRDFNLEEAKRIIKERPQKLSQQEMYHVANSYEKGSEDFNQVFDVAVRMYPDDELANLNAANVALSRNDKVSAEKFLAKAGTSPEAQNARGILAVKNEDYTAARTYFEDASNKGLAEAKANLEEMAEQGF